MQSYYAIMDKKAGPNGGAFPFPPFLVNHLEEALRAVRISLKDGKGPVSQFPADFALYLVAHWDSHTGTMLPPSTGQAQFTEEISNIISMEVKHA